MPSPSTTTTQMHWTGMVCLGVCTVVGTNLVRNMLIHYRDTTLIQEPRPKPQYITQDTEDTLSSSTLEKLVGSITYSIREIASRIVCDRALHDESAIDALLWYITRPEKETREKGLRALFMLATKSGMSSLNKPVVYEAVVKSLSFCVTDVPHDTYDREWDNWDFRDVNERHCLMIVHRLTIEFGISDFIQYGFIPKWLAKEPWGDTEEERQKNVMHCYNLPNLLSYIILQVCNDPVGKKQMLENKLITDEGAAPLFLRGGDERSIFAGGWLSHFEVMPSTEGGAPRIQERSREEQRLRRRHRDAMVLHDTSQPLGIDSIITRNGVDASDGITRDELTMEADRQLRTQGLLAALTPRRLENMREILRSESRRAEQAGLEEDSSVGILRDILENEINNRLGEGGAMNGSNVLENEIDMLGDDGALNGSIN